MYAIRNRGSRTNYVRSSIAYCIQSKVDDYYSYFTWLYLLSKHTTSAQILSKTCRIKPHNFVDYVWNVMGHAQKTRFRLSAKRTSPFQSAGGRQFSRLMAAEVCVSAVVMLDTPCSEVVWRVLATHSIRQFPLHFPSPPLVTMCHHVSTGLYLAMFAQHISSPTLTHIS